METTPLKDRSTFPIPYDDRPGAYFAQAGATVRVYAAIAIAQGLAANASFNGDHIAAAELAVLRADALLDQLERTGS